MTEAAIGEEEVTASGAVEKVFPPLDQTTLLPQVFWLGIIFIALYFLLKHLIIPRIAKILKERHDSLHTDLNAAKRLKEEVDTAAREYDKTISSARAHANNIGRKILDDLAADIQKERALAEGQMAEKLMKGEKKISDSKQETLSQIQGIALEITEPILAQLLGKKLSQEDIKREMPNSRSF